VTRSAFWLLVIAAVFVYIVGCLLAVAVYGTACAVRQMFCGGKTSEARRL